MKKQFCYEYEDDGRNRLNFDYSPEGEEKLDAMVENGVPFICLNRPAMMALARALIKVANGTYSDGFHIHLHKDFNADEPERLVVVLAPQSI
jgi:hypothetical protein